MARIYDYLNDAQRNAKIHGSRLNEDLTQLNAQHPATSTDNAIARYDGTTGTLQDSVVTVADTVGTLGFPTGGGFSFGSGAENVTFTHTAFSSIDIVDTTSGETVTLNPGNPGFAVFNPNANAATEFIGSMAWRGRDTAANTTLYSSLEGYIHTATDGAEVGWLVFNLANGAGSTNSTFQMQGTGALVGIPLASTQAPARRLDVVELNSATSTVTLPLRVQHASTGTPAADIGVGIEFTQETAANNHENIAVIAAVMSDVSAGAEDTNLHFTVMEDGVLPSLPQLLIQNNGVLINTAPTGGFPSLRMVNPNADTATDFVAAIEFKGVDSSANEQSYATIECYVDDPASGSEDASVYINNWFAGSSGLGIAVSRNTTATHTALMVWDNDNATLERVTVGTANSGGTGFKLLRIPN